ncbi:MAG: hypothetical protein KF805_15460 [Phycisphaeraceae bacterium]|nr:hypothetical protein [Phycisphaeraceae bacterium]
MPQAPAWFSQHAWRGLVIVVALFPFLFANVSTSVFALLVAIALQAFARITPSFSVALSVALIGYFPLRISPKALR